MFGSVFDHGQGGGSWNSKEAHESHKFGVRSSYNSYVCNRSILRPKWTFQMYPCGSEINFMLSSVYFPGWKPVINIFYQCNLPYGISPFYSFTVLLFTSQPMNATSIFILLLYTYPMYKVRDGLTCLRFAHSFLAFTLMANVPFPLSQTIKTIFRCIHGVL